MPLEQFSLFLELRRQIDDLVEKLAELRKQENEILRQMLSDTEQPEIPLNFDDKSQTVHWFDKSLKLGKKSYLFVKTLWLAPKHRKRTESLEQSVWKSRSRKQSRQVTVRTQNGIRKVRVVSRFLQRNTLKLFLFRLQNRLQLALFPYKIVPVKDRKTGEIIGFQLKCTKRYTKFPKDVPQSG